MQLRDFAPAIITGIITVVALFIAPRLTRTNEQIKWRREQRLQAHAAYLASIWAMLNWGTAVLRADMQALDASARLRRKMDEVENLVIHSLSRTADAEERLTQHRQEFDLLRGRFIETIDKRQQSHDDALLAARNALYLVQILADRLTIQAASAVWKAGNDYIAAASKHDEGLDDLQASTLDAIEVYISEVRLELEKKTR